MYILESFFFYISYIGDECIGFFCATYNCVKIFKTLSPLLPTVLNSCKDVLFICTKIKCIDILNSY